MKSGFVSIVGRPNVGKSTLLNELLKTKIAIVTNKVGTTRNNIYGVLNNDEFQIIFVDTPGISKANDKLGEVLNEKAYKTFSNDLVLFLVDIASGFGPNDKQILNRLIKEKQNIILILTKIDLIKKEKLMQEIIKIKDLYNFLDIVPISAKNHNNIDELLKVIQNYLPEGEKYFSDDYLTNISERNLVAEIIREKAMSLTEKEVPHALTCVVKDMIFKKNKVIINACIIVDRDNLKGIIIGQHGQMLKEIGTEARIELEKIFNKKVYLEILVKEMKDWRNDQNLIKELINFEEDD